MAKHTYKSSLTTKILFITFSVGEILAPFYGKITEGINIIMIPLIVIVGIFSFISALTVCINECRYGFSLKYGKHGIFVTVFGDFVYIKYDAIQAVSYHKGRIIDKELRHFEIIYNVIKIRSIRKSKVMDYFRKIRLKRGTKKLTVIYTVNIIFVKKKLIKEAFKELIEIMQNRRSIKVDTLKGSTYYFENMEGGD